jgi:hypothetical protein
MLLVALLLCMSSASGRDAAVDSGPVAKDPGAAGDDEPGRTAQASLFRSADDGWPDVSGFLDTKHGFLPVVIPITEPAVGYGAVGGAAFIDQPLGSGRPDITFAGGLGTENGTWGAAIGDSRNWLDNRVQTLAGLVYASVNLDFYGIGDDSVLKNNPQRYTLEPKGGILQSKYRLGGTDFWAGLSFVFASVEVSFDAPAGTPRLPDFSQTTDLGGIGPSLTYDSRDNIFTPVRGTYVEATANLFGEALGGDDDFQLYQVIAMQYTPLRPALFLGLRGQAASSSDGTPFYLRPFVVMRGVAAMRYQGENMAQIEAELRWQCWNRVSLVGFVGTGAAWNDLDKFEKKQAATAGGGGIRYEIARKYGLHMGADLAFGPDDTVLYIQFGSAWVRP